MQDLVNQEIGLKTKSIKLDWLPYVLLLVAINTTLLAIFGITSWVQLGGWHHVAQHLLIFSSGLVAGGSLMSIFKSKKER